MPSAALTFVVPGDNRSGGLRVTARMAGILLARGHRVRIVYPRTALLSLAAFARLRAWVQQVGFGPSAVGWLHTFAGVVEDYADINELRFEQGEIVIAVGTYMVHDVVKLQANGVVKVRYNHGLPARMNADFEAAWSLPMTTITVSATLVPQLERLSGAAVSAVVPNGIDLTDYHPEPGVKRDAIGTIFSSHPNKAPQDILRLFAQIEAEHPQLPRVVFSTEKKPGELARCAYERYPDIKASRCLYSRALIWTLASTTEGLPGSVLEAMACGAVVISTDNEGSLEVVKHNVNGLIVPRGDVPAFLAAIRAVLFNDALRERLVLEGHETARQFNWDRAADAMERFVQSLLVSTPMPLAQARRQRLIPATAGQ
jgi:glycosyltransferase involved in cell wall biosynthesis